MKEAVIILLVLACIALTVAGVFLAQMDPDEFKPYLEKALADTAGGSATIEEVRIRWGLDLGLELEGIDLRSHAGGPLLHASRAGASIDLRGLWRHELS